MKLMINYKNNYPNLVAIDDLADRIFCVDAIINQNLGSDELAYQTIKQPKLFLGTKYALLRNQGNGLRFPVLVAKRSFPATPRLHIRKLAPLLPGSRGTGLATEWGRAQRILTRGPAVYPLGRCAQPYSLPSRSV